MNAKLLRAVFINFIILYSVVRWQKDETAFLLALMLLPPSIALLYKRLE